jgi:hypothetical protein
MVVVHENKGESVRYIVQIARGCGGEIEIDGEITWNNDKNLVAGKNQAVRRAGAMDRDTRGRAENA